MKLTRISIRVRVYMLVLIPLLALIGIYSFAVAGQLGTAVGLSNAGKVAAATITPTSKLLVTLNSERSLAVGYLGTGSGTYLTQYQAEATATDQALRVLEGISGSGPVTANASALEKQAAASFLAAARALPGLRSEVANRTVSSASVITSYSAIVSDGIQVIGQSLQETYVSQSLAATSREEVSLYEAEMLVLQENDVYTAALLSGRLGTAQMTFGQLVSVRRYLVKEAVPQLDSEASAVYQKYVPATLSRALGNLEDQIIQAPAGGKPPVPLDLWQGTVKDYATNLETMLTIAPNWTQSQVTSSARSALITLIVGAVLGLLAVIASVVFSTIMGRRLLARLAGLRESALTLAHEQLPGIMTRLRRGERVNVDEEAPPAAESSVDELDQVRQAFTVVHRTAVAAAVEEANMRSGINEVFRNLARRNQLLLQRQLALLDGMERRAEEPDQLADLFRIDHLTTRMRRHAEGLIILSGAPSGRNWREPVPFIDVVRAAVAEVEDFTRVSVELRGKIALSGRAVADVIHLLAELIENATAFSPPQTKVTILGNLVGRGFAVEVQDLGLGIPEGRLEQINRDLASPPDFDLSRSDRLGLFIAGRLAARHGITVTLRQSGYAGIIAVVLVPGHLVVAEGPVDIPAASIEGGLPHRAAAKAALYSGTANASVESAPRSQVPAASWRILQKNSGKHAAGAAQQQHGVEDSGPAGGE